MGQGLDERLAREVLIDLIAQGPQCVLADQRIGNQVGQNLRRLVFGSEIHGEDGSHSRFDRELRILGEGCQLRNRGLVQPARDQLALRGQAAAMAVRLHQVQQLVRLGLDEVRQRSGLVPLRLHGEQIPHVLADIGERGPLPTRHDQLAVGVDIQIGHARNAEELGLVSCEGRSLRRHAVPVDHVPAPVARVGRVREPRRIARLGEVQPAAARPAAVDVQRLDGFVVEVHEERRVAVVFASAEVVQADVPAAAVVGVIACEGIEQWVDRDLQDVASPARVDLQFGPIRTDTDDSAASKLQRPAIDPFGLHESEVPDCQIQPTIDPQRDAVARVVRRAVLEPEGDVLDEDLLLVRHSIAVAVDERTQMRRMQHIESVAVPHQPARGVDIRHEVLRLVGPAISIEIPQLHDRPALGSPVERAVLVDRDVYVAVRGSSHEGRVVDSGRGSEELGLEAFGDLDVLEDLLLLLQRLAGGVDGHDFCLVAEEGHLADAAPLAGVRTEEPDSHSLNRVE